MPGAITPTITPSPETAVKKGRVKIEEEFGYEVVFLLRGEKLDVNKIRQTIIDMGGVSTVVAGDEKMLKVHTHTSYNGGYPAHIDNGLTNLDRKSTRLNSSHQII